MAAFSVWCGAPDRPPSRSCEALVIVTSRSRVVRASSQLTLLGCPTHATFYLSGIVHLRSMTQPW